ncbi:hypothetical protein SEA_RUBYRALPH_94 [Microbacterium phage RubyRalph]|nr:hypothetical protein SEA_RUBYRALPH_94 [Microbacterium phage RubyRalph]
MKSTLNLAAQGLRTADTWATYVTKFRIHYEPAEDHEPWVLDAINENTLELSEEIEYHDTLEAAVADMAPFLERNKLTLLPRKAVTERAQRWGELAEEHAHSAAHLRLIPGGEAEPDGFFLNPEQLHVVLTALRDHANTPINHG